MSRIKTWIEPILRAVVSILYIWVLMASLTNILLSPVSFWLYAVSGVGMYLLLRLFTGSRPGRITGGIVLVPAFGVVLFLLLDRGEAHKAFLKWAETLGQAFEKLYFFEPLAGTRYAVFQTPVVLMLTALTTVVVWLFHEKRFRFLPLTAYGIVCMLLSFEMAGYLATIPFLLFILLSVCTYAGSVYDRRRRENVENPPSGAGRMMLQALPVALLTLLLTLPFQKPDEPMRWKWLEQKTNDLYTRIEEKFTHTDTEFFSLSATGFSGREHLLGGRVRQSNTFVMEVRADRRAYLRGAAYQNYTGTSWMTADPGFDYASEGYPESARDLDEMGSVFALVPPALLYQPPGQNAEDPDTALPVGTRRTAFVDESQQMLADKLAAGELTELLFPMLNMDVTYRNLTTRTLFAPLKTLLPVQDAQSNVLPVTQNSRAILLAPSFLGSGSQYSLDYRQPMYGDQILMNLLPLSRKGLYDDATRTYVNTWNELVRMAEFGDVFTTEVMDDDTAVSVIEALVSPNRLDANGKELPPTDMAGLSTYLIKNGNPLDTPVYQQLLDLEMRANELHRKYTTLPETVTVRTRQFAQDLTEGLSSDYEKVVAVRDALRELFPYTLVMPRLPENSDFVDWFLFEQQSGYCTSYATAMTVLLRTLDIPARYVEGYVLPEKAEDEEFYRVTNRYAHAWTEVFLEGFGWLSFEPTPGFAGTTDFLAQNAVDMSEYIGSDSMPDLEELMRMYGENRDLESEGSVFTDSEATATPMDLKTLLLFALAGLALAILLTDLVSRITEAVRFGRTPPRRQVVYRYLRMLDWLKLAGIALDPGETLPEFAARVDNEYYFPESSFKQLSALFSRVRYGAVEPSSAETRLMREMARELRGQIVREIGLRRLLPLRHVLLRI